MRGLRLVSETRIHHRSPVPAGSDRAVAAACMARLLRVTSVLEERDGVAFDRVEAERALAFFAVIAEGISDAAPQESAALVFFADNPDFCSFILTGDVDALICAAAGVRSAPVRRATDQHRPTDLIIVNDELTSPATAVRRSATIGVPSASAVAPVPGVGE